MLQEVLFDIGQFSDIEIALFEKFTTRKTLNKNDILLKEGEIYQEGRVDEFENSSDPVVKAFFK